MIVIILGSKSDLPWGIQISNHLSKFSVTNQIQIASAHKTPEYLLKIIRKFNSIKKPLVYICVAGRSNALGGFVDSNTRFPVINCPPPSEKFAGLDILSSLRMPSGVSCATVLEPEQAAIIAVKILALENKTFKASISAYQKKLKVKIIEDDQSLNK